MTLRSFRLSGPLLLVVLLLGCDRAVPFEPAISAASNGGAGPTPSAPSGLNAVAVSQSRIDVSWQDNSTNESGFEVHRSTMGASGTFTLRASTGVGVTSYGDVGLTSSTQFCYKVRAFRTTGSKTSSSGFSTAACATTLAPPPPPPPPAVPPNAPSGTDAIPAGSSAVGITWTDNSSNEGGFRIERSTDGGATWVIAGTTVADMNGAPFFDEGRPSEEQVCYRVVAFSSQGDSSPSSVDCTAPPAGPTNLTATPQGDLTWTDNSAVEDGYEVWFLDAFGVAYEGLIARLPPNSTSFSRDFCAETGWCWGYAVVAVKDGGYSDWVAVNGPRFP